MFVLSYYKVQLIILFYSILKIPGFLRGFLSDFLCDFVKRDGGSSTVTTLAAILERLATLEMLPHCIGLNVCLFADCDASWIGVDDSASDVLFVHRSFLYAVIGML